MQTSTPTGHQLDAALLALPHRHLNIAGVHLSDGHVKVSGFWPTGRDSDRDNPQWHGRAALNFITGGWGLHLNPTVADLRALARLCTSMADDREALAQRLAGTAAEAA